MLKIRHSIGRASHVDYSTFDERPIECRKSDIRRRALRMSNIRHSKKGSSGVEYSTFEEGCFGCRIFDIRLTADRMSKIRHPKKGASDIEYSTEANIGSKIESFCTPLIHMVSTATFEGQWSFDEIFHYIFAHLGLYSVDKDTNHLFEFFYWLRSISIKPIFLITPKKKVQIC